MKKSFFKIDLLFLASFLASLSLIGVLFLLLYEIGGKALPAISSFGLNFLFSWQWQPNRDLYGVFPMIIGSLESSFLALFLALPLAVAMAIFLTENFFPPALRRSLRFLIDLLAATPSVVYGLWGIFSVVPLVKQIGIFISKKFGFIPLFKAPVYGNSLLTASLVLAIMILPTITAIARNALDSVPQVLREGSYALGATRWEAILRVLLPYALPGVVAGAILGFGRAIGETMAVAMLIGNSQRWSLSLFSPSNTLSALLANQFSEADGLQVHALMYASLVLIVMTLGTNLIGELVLKKLRK